MTSSRPSILALVLSVDREPWRGIEIDGQRATWASPEAIPEGCEVVYYYGVEGLYRFVGRAVGRMALVGGGNPVSRAVRRSGESLLARISKHAAGVPAALDGDRLTTHVPDAHKFTLAKLISALRWATAPDRSRFDFIYRTNTSSYVTLPRLQEVAAAMPQTGCYAGFIGQHPSKQCAFASGSGMLLSWDIAARAASEPTGWDWGTIDDAALGDFLATNGIVPEPLPRVAAHDLRDIESLSDEELRKAFHFRCKSSSEPRADAAIMQAIHRRLYGEPDAAR